MNRREAIGHAIRLEWITLGWMTIEAAIAIAAGIAAHSVSVTAFGLDSVVELLSGGVVMWRLRVELQQGREFSNRIEHRAHQAAGALLFALAAYVVIAAGASIYERHGQEFSLAGAAVCAIAATLMYPLARAKLKAAEQLASRALRADAAESLTCGYVSVAVLAGMIAQRFLGAWWIDAVVSLGVVYYLVKEGREAFGEAECCT